MSDRWGVGKHLGSKIKSRELKQINFFTSSRRDWNFVARGAERASKSFILAEVPASRNGSRYRFRHGAI